MKIDSATVSKHRNKLKLNQKDFWSPLGVTQSGGSRYESGRNIPVPVQKLFFLVYLASASIVPADAKRLASIGR